MSERNSNSIVLTFINLSALIKQKHVDYSRCDLGFQFRCLIFPHDHFLKVFLEVHYEFVLMSSGNVDSTSAAEITPTLESADRDLR